MLKKAAALPVFVLALALVLGFGSRGAAERHDVLARFDGGIGVSPVLSFAWPLNSDGTFQNVLRNAVRGVRSATQPWRIDALTAEVTTDGRVTASGRGLLLAGGDNIGRAPAMNLVATLICEARAPFVAHNSADTSSGSAFSGGEPLEANGDFRINAVLRTAAGSVEPLPAECESPVLLVRSSASGAWLTAGLPQSAGRVH